MQGTPASIMIWVHSFFIFESMVRLFNLFLNFVNHLFLGLILHIVSFLLVDQLNKGMFAYWLLNDDMLFDNWLNSTTTSYGQPYSIISSTIDFKYPSPVPLSSGKLAFHFFDQDSHMSVGLHFIIV